MGGAFALVELAAQCVAGKHRRGPAVLQGNANGVLNLSRGHFVITHQAGKNRQTGGVGRSPGPRTLRVAVTQQVPNRRRGCIPAPVAVGDSAEQFVEKTIAVIEHQHMAIAIAGIGIALNRRIARYRHRPRVTFGAISGESDARPAPGIRSTTEYGMPIFEPWYCPDPKSACIPTLDPMKLMMASEFGSTGEAEISLFQRLSLLKGRKPLRLAPCPALIALQALWIVAPTAGPAAAA